MNLARALAADRISVLHPAAYSAGAPQSLDTIFKDGIAYLADYPPARFYFVRFPDETIAIQTPRGEARCFGKYGYGGSYFVQLADGAVWLYSPQAENGWEQEWVLANSSLALFVQSYCRLMAAVFRLKADFAGGGEKGETFAAQLQSWLAQADPAAAAGDAFWPTPFYEIEEGFFPLAHNPVHRQIGMPEHRYQENQAT
ncbi:SUKH-4 family immunity protein [Eikenella sp. S3360]|uniref:SUKH-4 family immunity protein n=1 Tax=Eikenella glucosivorans TaxID=2766967 RepID=A0ABS0ND22_9NEIS|nr:SUKH-4 family immunity protein [Eikenella glucosivorans]MBH5330209.1 SUKH-4 family immunity protein [Eikenella glucosivorans]